MNTPVTQFKNSDQEQSKNQSPANGQSQFVHAYYQSLFGRNVINTKVIPPLLAFVCFPKLILEVFTRRRMGERYFSKTWAVVLGIILLLLPRLASKAHPNPGLFSYYLFVAGYVIMTAVCFIEIKRAPSVFDFARFGLDPGQSLSFFKRIRIFGKTPTQRMIDVWLEPLFCFAIGFVLLLLSQYLTAIVILFSALCYFISNYSFALRGDHFIMAKIDEILCNQDLTQTFIQNKDMSPRGVPFYAQKPSTRELRENLAAAMFDDYDGASVAR